MPVALTFSGVYIEEIPSGVGTITGVATSTRCHRAGPAGTDGWGAASHQLRGLRTAVRGPRPPFGAWDTRSSTSTTTGGADAYVLRIAEGDADNADAALGDLMVTATSPGEWAGDYRERLTQRTDDATRFKLEVLNQPSNDAVVESFENCR